MNSKVYVVNLSPKDYSSVDSYGDTVFMTEGILDLKRLNQYKPRFENYLKNATDSDYLLFSGPTVICALATMVWFSFLDRSRCKILTWNKVKNEYILNEICR